MRVSTELCQGTLVVHLGDIVECTTDECVDHDHARHELVVDCFDLASGCVCAERTSHRATA